MRLKKLVVNESIIKNLNDEFVDKTPEDILKWCVDELHPNISLATSFQAQGMVLIDMLMKINNEARIFTIDTGRLNQETYDVLDEISVKYKKNVEVLFPDFKEVEKMVSEKGINLFYKGVDNRILCCQIRKTNPLNRYLKTLDGWITSIRRDQTESRATAQKFEIDTIHDGILKVNPIVDWTDEMVWDYIKSNNVPYSKLYDKGYMSIGCEPCTRAVKKGEDPRAGRWWWESDSNKECGIHFDYNSK
ncbi:MAG: phosphoadenylyl-sulfate reductase [Thermodesulfobacteriota bacterium]